MAHVPAELAVGQQAGRADRLRSRAASGERQLRSLPIVEEVVLMLDGRGHIVSTSAGVGAFTGYPTQQLVGSPVRDLVHETDREKLDQLLEEMRTSRLALTMTSSVVTSTGESVPVEAVATNIVDAGNRGQVSLKLWRLQANMAASNGGEPTARAGSSHAAESVVEEREFLGALVGNLEAGVIACDAAGRVTVTNAMFRQLGDYSPEAVAVGVRPPVEGMFWPDGSPVDLEDHPLRQALSDKPVSDMELIFEPSGRGQRRVVTTSANLLMSSEGRLLGAVAAFHDVTDVKHATRELADLALHDPLTGCANRLLLTDRADRAKELARREGSSVGLLLIDLDDFKQVNDTYGHLVGDEVLTGVGRRLGAVVRPADTVARYGGDEFVILCQISGSSRELAAVKSRIVSRLAEPFRIGEDLLEVGASVGSAILPGPEADLPTLLSQADAEMYQQKLARRG